MSSGSLLEIQPNKLSFPFELKKQSSCSLQLTNKTDQSVAFKVKTTNPKQYCVRPNIGVILPRTTCNVTITMQAQKVAPPDMQCRDKFLIQSVVTQDGLTTKELPADLFNKEQGKVMDESKLRVVYRATNRPSPVLEESEEGTSPRSSIIDSGTRNLPMFDSVSRSFDEISNEKTEVIISKLTEEKTDALEQNQKLRQELELLRKERNKSKSGFSLKFLFIVGLIGVLIGYIIKRI